MIPDCIPVISIFFQVGNDELGPNKAKLNHSLVNQYSLTLGQDLGQHDTKSLIKCVETLSFIVRDAAHVTPDNFELCVRAIRVFVEASLNGGESLKYSLIAVLDLRRCVLKRIYKVQISKSIDLN